ncbi:valine--tRNA ligase, partial [archaeon]|nr:valine--tRNA ligase [archaeon]
ASSQVELEDVELDSFFNDLDFKLKDGGIIKIATTRPELLAACVSIFVHPTDKRYTKLIGKKAIVPIFGQEVTILADEKADPEKGTGAVMCCTFGDQNDIDWWYAHKLPLRVAISKNGVMTDISGKYAGLKIAEARNAIISDLKKDGALTNQKPIKHAVNVHERCGTAIEFLVTKQWFIKVIDMIKDLLKAGNKMNWYPKHMKVRYDNWTNGLSWDWCISRQRFYGIPFPVWYCKDCGEIIIAEKDQLPVNPFNDKPKNDCAKCGSKEYVPEEDTMDTWATSSLTPLINARWGEKDEIKDLYPIDLRPQAHDIITFWLFNTVVKGLLHKKTVPFKNVMISGHALDPKGKKMSKSKGNVILPQIVMEKFSADALRFWASGSKLGDDLPYQEKDVLTGHKMANKMWNASKFTLMHLDDYDLKDAKPEATDKWILMKLNDVIDISTKSLEKYEYAKAKAVSERFFFESFCDNYLEMAKDRLYNPDVYGEESRRAAQYTLYHSLLGILKLLAPIMPYITEEIYHLYFAGKEKCKSIHVSTWPVVNKNWTDKTASMAGDAAVEIVSAIRQYKSSNNLALNTKYESAVINTNDKKMIGLIENTIKGTMKIGKISYATVSKADIEFEIGETSLKIKMGKIVPKEKK